VLTGPKSRAQSPRFKSIAGPAFNGVLVCFSLLCAGLATSVAAAQVPDEPIKWALTVDPATATTTRGGAITLALTATIDDGWHLYSTKLPEGGPIPTRISVPTDQQFKAAGDIVEPTPKSAFDANFNMTLEFYEDKVTFGVPMKASGTAPLGAVPARVAVSFQTCNDKFCLPPKQVVATVQVKVTANRPGPTVPVFIAGPIAAIR
jgi:thiol:disulfide interchange protein DsbD